MIFDSLRDVDRQTTFVGGLDTEDGDGDYAYMWEDDVMQVIFHVATLMPNHPKTDPKCNKKKRHIGNDFVCIVYNNAGKDFWPILHQFWINFLSIFQETTRNTNWERLRVSLFMPASSLHRWIRVRIGWKSSVYLF